MPCIIIHLFVNSKLEGILRILRVQKIGVLQLFPSKKKILPSKLMSQRFDGDVAIYKERHD